MSNAKLVRKRFVTEEIVRRDEVTWENKQGQKEPVTYNGEPVYYDEYPPVSSQKYEYVEPVEDVLPPAPTPIPATVNRLWNYFLDLYEKTLKALFDSLLGKYGPMPK